ncbi:unnamed protein product [Protopolystoma xenopodis]|uniref:Secreted protein n=1 Tax=Protopolystoma xenopodis TaxID=117903 RepID=A0A3S5A5L8_9PLAT|nr:unnamed protein product [Protopolystoma xenopodis]
MVTWTVCLAPRVVQCVDLTLPLCRCNHEITRLSNSFLGLSEIGLFHIASKMGSLAVTDIPIVEGHR